MYKILIASDRDETRELLKRICKEQGFLICGEAKSLEHALILSELHLPSIVIFNFRCALQSQTLLISQISRIGKSVRVFIYSALGPTRSTRAYIRAGASGFLSEESNTEEFVRVLRGMLAGFTMVPIKALKQPRVRLAHRPAAGFVARTGKAAFPP